MTAKCVESTSFLVGLPKAGISIILTGFHPFNLDTERTFHEKSSEQTLKKLQSLKKECEKVALGESNLKDKGKK